MTELKKHNPEEDHESVWKREDIGEASLEVSSELGMKDEDWEIENLDDDRVEVIFDDENLEVYFNPPLDDISEDED